MNECSRFLGKRGLVCKKGIFIELMIQQRLYYNVGKIQDDAHCEFFFNFDSDFLRLLTHFDEVKINCREPND